MDNGLAEFHRKCNRIDDSLYAIELLYRIALGFDVDIPIYNRLEAITSLNLQLEEIKK